MRILICIGYYYYNQPGVEDAQFSVFTGIPKSMGHEIHFIDHIAQAISNKDMFNDFFLSVVMHGNYDLVLIQLYKDEFYPEVLEKAKNYTNLVSWNSDDDWRWDDYSSKLYPHFTHMVTTYRHIYEANEAQYPNLILSQWGCSGFFDGKDAKKDINLSFVGLNYGQRANNIKYINERIPILTFGRGTPTIQLPWKKQIKKVAAGLLGLKFEDNTLSGPDEVNNIWNRSRLSYTPLEASKGTGLQIKWRVFEMGLSGTVMLCNKNPELYEFYEPGKEFMEFGNLDELIDKAKYLLNHEAERAKIALAYRNRTQKEHLWKYRFEKLFQDIRLK